MMIQVGDKVKFSTVYLRSVGAPHGWRGEVQGVVVELFRSERSREASTWDLALVRWDGGNGYSEVNAANLVQIKDVDLECRQAEKDGIPGLVIGSNAFAVMDI